MIGKKRRATKGLRVTTRCMECGEEFSGERAEQRHTAETGHYRYEMLLGDRR